MLKLSQSAVGIWKQWRYNRCRPYQMNAKTSNNNGKSRKKCNAHRKPKCKCHWWAWTHQLAWKAICMTVRCCCDGQTCTNLRHTHKNTTNINTPDKERRTRMEFCVNLVAVPETKHIIPSLHTLNMVNYFTICVRSLWVSVMRWLCEVIKLQIELN